jgi:nucleoside-diphosphate-sugar epimerase
VCLALSPLPGEDGVALWGTLVPRLVLAAWRDGATAVTVCGPAGRGEPGIDAFAHAVTALTAAPRTTVLRFGPLFGQDDACVWPLLTALRQDGVVRLPRGLPTAWPLWIDDAARAVSRAWDTGGQRVLRGPEGLTTQDVGAAMTARFGGRQAWRWWPGERHLPRLRAWAELPDDWDDAGFGPRMSLGRWIERLPGLRRRR